jgi:hypothetical protein
MCDYFSCTLSQACYDQIMALDPKIIREAQAAYRQWNEAELRERLLTAPSRPPEEAWQQFLALWEFAWQTHLKASETQQRQKTLDLERYYQRMLKFEAWRKRHGSAS